MTTIYLNIYDLPEQESRNEALQGVGVGFFHSGVEIRTERGSQYEYSFSNAGIQRTRPQLAAFGHLREQIFMGRLDNDLGWFTEQVNNLGRVDFRPYMYNIVHRNCNHFSDAFCKVLLNKAIPEWVNRAAQIASTFASKPTETPATSTGQAFAMPGVVKGPDLSKYKDKGETRVTTTAATPPTTSTNDGGGGGIFSWIFGSSPTTNTSAAASSSTPVVASSLGPPKKINPKAKKELTEKQQAALAKIKIKGDRKE